MGKSTPPLHQVDIEWEGAASRMIRDPTKAFEGPQAHDSQAVTRIMMFLL